MEKDSPERFPGHTVVCPSSACRTGQHGQHLGPFSGSPSRDSAKAGLCEQSPAGFCDVQSCEGNGERGRDGEQGRRGQGWWWPFLQAGSQCWPRTLAHDSGGTRQSPAFFCSWRLFIWPGPLLPERSPPSKVGARALPFIFLSWRMLQWTWSPHLVLGCTREGGALGSKVVTVPSRAGLGLSRGGLFWLPLVSG